MGMNTQAAVPTGKAGAYRCPYKCGDARFPAPKWKTEAGALAHIAKCPKRPEAVAERQQAEDARRATEDAAKDAALKRARHKIGDTIHYVRCIVLTPTHVQRGSKMVRVRYDEERSYRAQTEQVRSIGFHGGALAYNVDIVESDIFATPEAAAEEARKRQSGYAEAVTFAQACR